MSIFATQQAELRRARRDIARIEDRLHRISNELDQALKCVRRVSGLDAATAHLLLRNAMGTAGGLANDVGDLKAALAGAAQPEPARNEHVQEPARTILSVISGGLS